MHLPVMFREVLHYLQLSEGLSVMDGTVGAAGHSQKILERLGSNGRLFGFDRDPMMLNHARQKITQKSDSTNVQLFHSSYADAAEVFSEHGIDSVDRVLLDLGLSSDQLADRERGFGFDAGGALDMRFDTSRGHSAEDLIRTADRQQLESIFTDFGEENFARQIAAQICQQRSRQPIQTTEDLEACVMAAIPRASRRGRNPATRVFQALRISVNDELEHVQRMMTTVLPAILKPNGIAVILTFHSLEDRIVKSAFKGHKEWQVLTKTPIESTPAEIRLNPRSRSARLRAAVRRNL
ncbi:MAG: 16S rRNA (cytosine(1402)-N(4))-methyltransferase RsmH [Fuerstiella sp.]|nr:16S rRNA (cytosine(1402)-N(4))-methyltransferase RsmH [Fuerstiella sp.]MCP4507408.1 16S rRNA (cytosine(1402)-N(4))-methyltransferase RsmH [Fuerstiella sp.]